MAEKEERTILLRNGKKFKSYEPTWKKYKLEPALLLVFFGWNLSASVLPNQLLRGECLARGYDESDCSHLGGNNLTKTIEEEIQPRVAEILMTIKLLTSVIPAILSLFVGSWSDTFGRKKVFCTNFIGYGLTCASFGAVALIENYWRVNPWFYVIPHIAMTVAGGWPAILLSILCYTTDVTDEYDRSSRLGIMEISMFVGVLLGTGLSGYVLILTSASTVFLISTLSIAIASIYSIIFVDESVIIVTDISLYEQLKRLFRKTAVKEMFQTGFRQRFGFERRILWCLIVIRTLTVFAINGSGNVFYLFTRERFQWTLVEYAIFDSTSSLISNFGCFIAIAVLKNGLHFSDLSIAIIALVSRIVEASFKILNPSVSLKLPSFNSSSIHCNASLKRQCKCTRYQEFAFSKRF